MGQGLLSTIKVLPKMGRMNVETKEDDNIGRILGSFLTFLCSSGFRAVRPSDSNCSFCRPIMVRHQKDEPQPGLSDTSLTVQRQNRENHNWKVKLSPKSDCQLILLVSDHNTRNCQRPQIKSEGLKGGCREPFK